jgi:D-alanyl-D-alanine carboxypeptidase
LISDHIKEAALRRTVPVVAARDDQHDDAQPVAFGQAPTTSHADQPLAAAPNTRVTAGNDDPIRPLLVKTVTYRIAPVQPTPLTPMPALVPVAAPAARAAPAQSAAPQPFAASQAVSPPTAAASVATSQPTAAPAVEPAPAAVVVASAELPATTATTAPSPSEQVHARGGWLIQIGAFEGEDEAKEHLSAAQLKVHDILAVADPFTERVQKGDKALYRARFAGFDKATAEAACKQLKHNDFACMTVKE